MCARGDAAVREFSAKFDGVAPEALGISMAEREAAVAALDPRTRVDTEFAIANVRRFAEAQLATMSALAVEMLPGVQLGHRVIPIHRVGACVPGGRFPLLSAPILTILPVIVAGVGEIAARLPPKAHQAMVAGCHLAGAHRIFRIAGAQAIVAMAFGSESVPRVHMRDPRGFAEKLDNDGSLFVGTQASVVYSDKCSGTNHTLPTMGAFIGLPCGGGWSRGSRASRRARPGAGRGLRRVR
jgi:histidinol dehydrogenase